MNVELMKFAPLAQAILEQYANVAKATLSDEQKEHNKEVDATVSAKLRDYAVATAADGVDAALAGQFVRTWLTVGGMKKGTVGAYGKAVDGFRKLIAEGKDISKASTVDAQNAAKSDEQKAKDALRDQIKPFVRDATVEQLQAILTYAQSLNIAVKARKTRSDAGAVTDVTPAPVEQVEEQPQAVAL